MTTPIKTVPVTSTTNLRLNDGDFQDVEFKNRTHLAEPDAAHNYDALFSPLYWSNVAKKMQVKDVIRVIPKGMAYFAELLVVEVGPTTDRPGAPFARVIQLRKIDLSAKKKAAVLEPITGFKIKDRGPKGWSVIRLAGNSVVKEGCATEAEAQTWLDANSTPAPKSAEAA